MARASPPTKPHPVLRKICTEIREILDKSDKQPANGLRMIRAWQKSSPFNFGDRDCRGGCSGMAGGWNHRPLALVEWI
jgi:hypothetical protein